MDERVISNTSDERGRKIYSYIKRVVQEVIDVKLVAEHTTFNAKECKEIKRRLLDGPLDCFFTDGDECRVISVSDLLSVFRVQSPIPKDLPQYH